MQAEIWACKTHKRSPSLKLLYRPHTSTSPHMHHRKPIDLGVVTLIFNITKVKFGFLRITQKVLTIILIFGSLGPSQMYIDLWAAILNFMVSECKKVKNHFDTITPKTIRAISLKLG